MGDEMSGGGEGPAAGPDWVRLRQEYEEGAKPVVAIAAEAGVSSQKLVILARREGWKLRGPANPRTQGTRETIARLKSLLQKRLAELESQIGALGEEASASSSERDIRSMNTLVRTLEKVLELERKDRAHRNRKRREQRVFDDAERDQLAERLEALHREWTGQKVEPGAEYAPGQDGQLGLADHREEGPASA